jgi:hypothetical protein
LRRKPLNGGFRFFLFLLNKVVEICVMKIGGITVSRNEQILVLPRLEQPLVIKAAALLSYEEFDALVPRPTAPVRLTKNGKEPHTDSPDFKSSVEQFGKQRWAFIVLKSLEPSEIEWDEVVLGDPSTWCKWPEELKKAGLSDTEIGRVSTLVMEVNSLDESKLEEARKLFLAGQAAAE